MIVGATSWQIPGTYLENVRLIAGHADFVELLIYTWDEDTRRLLDLEWPVMQAVCPLSIHLPTDSLDHIEAALDYFREKEVYRLTMHPIPPLGETLYLYHRYQEVYPGKLLLENLENDYFDRMLTESDPSLLSFTFDVGHFLLLKRDVPTFFQQWRRQIREVHFHGIAGNKDHALPDPDAIRTFKNWMKRFDSDNEIPVCVELFEWVHTAAVLKELKDDR